MLVSLVAGAASSQRPVACGGIEGSPLELLPNMHVGDPICVLSTGQRGCTSFDAAPRHSGQQQSTHITLATTCPSQVTHALLSCLQQVTCLLDFWRIGVGGIVDEGTSGSGTGGGLPWLH